MGTHEDQGGIEILVILLDIVRIVFHRLPLVHRIEVDTGVIGLDWLEERSESILKTMPAQRSGTQAMYGVLRHTTSDQFTVVVTPFRCSQPFLRPP